MTHIIAPEGYRQRSAQDTAGFQCVACKHKMLMVVDTCPTCGMRDSLQPIISRDQYHDQTRAIKESKRVQHFSPGYDSTDVESQKGKRMFPEDLFMIIRAALSGMVVKQSWNPVLKRLQWAMYAPIHCKPEDVKHLSIQEQNDKLQHVCNCEMSVLPEWDIITKNADDEPTGLVRGWRSVLGIFYRKGLIPWVPDDGRRLSAHTIKSSPMQAN